MAALLKRQGDSSHIYVPLLQCKPVQLFHHYIAHLYEKIGALYPSNDRNIFFFGCSMCWQLGEICAASAQEPFVPMKAN